MSQKIKLSYSCRQDWDTMSLSSKGKYCDSCQHDVVDLSAMNFNQIQRTLSNLEKGACVNIPEAYAEQEKTIEFSISQEIKQLALAASLTGAVLSIPAQTSEPTQIESASVLSADSIKLNQDPTELITYSVSKGSSQTSSNVVRDPIKRRKKLFLNRRFPFVHYRSPYRTLGRTTVCPIF